MFGRSPIFLPGVLAELFHWVNCSTQFVGPMFSGPMFSGQWTIDPPEVALIY